jgi:hypothetical protein
MIRGKVRPTIVFPLGFLSQPRLFLVRKVFPSVSSSSSFVMIFLVQMTGRKKVLISHEVLFFAGHALASDEKQAWYGILQAKKRFPFGSVVERIGTLEAKI